MIALHDWLTFTLAALLVTLAPGPAVIMALSNSMAHGPARTMIGSLGNGLGLLVVATATSAGVGAVLIASASAFLVLKVAGASYLVYLGLKQWRSRSGAFDSLQAVVAVPVAARRLFLNGFIVAITNPKAILFFAAFLPQFIPQDQTSPGLLAVLIITFAACAMSSHFIYAMLAQPLKKHLNSAQRTQALNRMFGASFVGLGVGLLTLKGKAA